MINSYLGPGLAISHTLVLLTMRALTLAIQFLVLNMIGLALGPLVVGLLSELYLGYFGHENLRYAMLTVVFLGVSAAPLLFLGARYLSADLARRISH